jgi:hypothetical protein
MEIMNKSINWRNNFRLKSKTNWLENITKVDFLSELECIKLKLVGLGYLIQEPKKVYLQKNITENYENLGFLSKQHTVCEFNQNNILPYKKRESNYTFSNIGFKKDSHLERNI